MECDRAAGLLSRLVDGTLGPLARFRMSRHVAGCDACAAQVEELRAMQRSARTCRITALRRIWQRESAQPWSARHSPPPR